MNYEKFFAYLSKTEKKISEYLSSNNHILDLLKPEDIYESVNSYIKRPAKRLRPSVLLMACGCLGGEKREKIAIPAAAGIELFHTWTLVHDDLIDNDILRRGQPTVHHAMEKKAADVFKFNRSLSKEYGRDIAILTGDMQHAWSIVSFIDCAYTMDVEPKLILSIIRQLQTYVIANLIYGEVLDVQYGLQEGFDLLDIDENKIVKMLWLKTGVLYEFAAMSGALIGKNTIDFEDNEVVAIKNFASNCGTAFQLQDDILGIVGNEKTLGKPVGSDIREGKKTVIVYEVLKNANDSQKNEILGILGNKKATQNDIEKISNLFIELGGISRAKKLAIEYTNKALSFLDTIDTSCYKDLLILWAEYMINRDF